MSVGGGRFDFDDGGTYCGGWEDGKANGHGVCTGPKGQGEYAGAWQYGYEVSGVYTWPSGNQFEGQWLQGKRHGLGVESKGRWVYRGEWTQGFKGRYGTRTSVNSGAKYEGTWTTGMQDGYGVESYADGGTYQGQWLRGTRHGYGVRQSVPYGLASHYRPKALRTSLTSLRSEQEADHVVKERDKKLDESRGGFVLKARSDEEPNLRRLSLFDKHGRNSIKKTILSGLKLKKQKSTGDINDSPRRPTGSVRSTISNISHMSMDSTQSAATNLSRYTDSNLSFISQDDITDVNVTETYMGEWKNDKRSGFGISERSDGLKYEGEWYNNKKYGYGITSFKEGSKEEGKYKNNTLISSGKKNKLFLIRSSKLRERIDNAVGNAQRAAQIAIQKADIAISRMANARAKAEQAEHEFAQIARQDSDLARIKAKEFAPEFHQPGTDILKRKMERGGISDSYGNLAIIPNHHHHNPQVQRSKTLMRNHTGNHHDSMDLHDLDQHDHINRPGMVHALSTAMDCALAGSSSKIVQGLNKLENEPDDYKRMDRSNHDGYLSDRGGLDHRNRPDPRMTPDYHRRQQSGGPPMYGEKPENLSDLLNSTLINDHFDQYRTHRGDSGLGRDIYVDDRYPSYPTNVTSNNMDPSPDSGVSDSESYRPSVLNRRKTLPSIVQGRSGGTANVSPTRTNTGKPSETLSSENLASKKLDTDMYVIENGIRKRVHAEVHETKTPAAKGLPNRYKLEKERNAAGKKSAAKRGSLPDVSACKELEKTVIPRREMSKLSSKRREELIKEKEEEERRKRGDVVIRFTDLKDWCQQRRLLMFVIAVNVSLATMFFNLLSQQ